MRIPSPIPAAVRAALVSLGVLAVTYADDVFPTPDILEGNVAFWKKIYTEVSLTEGLLHDREYPLVIYAKVSTGDASGSARRRIIGKHRDRALALINGIIKKPGEEWSAEEKRIAELFATYAPGDNDALLDARGRIRFQRGQRERFKKGLHRSGAYLDSIKAILAQYDIPQRLIYLPHVESSFNPFAYSKVGAAGLWQFMRSTGKVYMEVGYLVDERRDPLLSAHAAAKLLKHNYSVLKSWPLAITAYNHGLYGMKRAVATCGSRDIAVIIQKHRSRSFRFASKNFYSCFLAASEIAMEPEKYFENLTYASPIQYNTTTLTHYITPTTLVRHLGVPLEELIALNPAVRPVVFHQDKPIPKGTSLRIPVTLTLADARSAMEAIPDSLKLTTPPKPRYYRVRRGDNLYAIARRLGVTVSALALENDINRVNRIYAGQVLRVPGSEAAKPKATAVAAAEPSEPKPALHRPKPKPPAAPPESDTVAVAAVDTLPTEELPDTLKAIAMAAADTIPETASTTASPVFARFDATIYDLGITVSPVGGTATITVAVDETIGHYGDWLDIPTYRVRQLNRMGRRSGIRLGRRITVPADPELIERFRQKRLEYHLGLEEDFYSQYRVVELKVHEIQRGETIWEVCAEEGEIPLWLVKKHNKHLDLARLDAGMKIWIPVVAERTDEQLAQHEEGNPEAIYPFYREPGPSPSRPVRLTP